MSGRNLYGGTYTMFNDILPTFGITVRFVDETDPANFAKAADDKTRAFFCETVSNPACVVVELDKVAEAAHGVGVPLVVDATFTTPYLSQPIALGADVVCHSLTKWIGGHGTGIGGMVVDAGKFKWGAGKHTYSEGFQACNGNPYLKRSEEESRQKGLTRFSAVEKLNEMFRNAEVGNDLEKVGLLFHGFDAERNQPWAPYKPCRQGYCARFSEEWPGSIINAHQRHTSSNTGILLAPVRSFCG